MIVSSLFSYGVVPELPLRGFPPGPVEVVMKADQFVRVIVTTKDGRRAWTPKVVSGHWEPCLEHLPKEGGEV